jgi:hypothetical protein
MKNSTLSRIKALFVLIDKGLVHGTLMSPLHLRRFLTSSILPAQQTNTSFSINPQTEQLILQRMEQPEAKVQYVSASQTEPVYSDLGLSHGPLVGSRYDLTEFVVLKLQCDYTALRRDQAIYALPFQASFTF